MKNTSILISIGILLSVFPTHISKSCGPQKTLPYTYSFINKDIIPTDIPYAPYLLRFEDFYETTIKPKEIQATDNVSEWQERTCQDASKKDIYELIYKGGEREFKLMQTAVKSDKIGLPARLSSNSFAQFLVDKKCIETIDYLLFAKNCEPHVIASSDPWNIPKRDTIAMEFLIQKGKKAFKKTKSHYIKLRYAYQIIRLAHYKKNYQQVLDLEDFLMPKTDAHPSLIHYWIMGHKAGALLKLGRNVEASHLYALIFEHCPSKRDAAFRSFYINNDEQWNECLLLCESDAERAILYTIRAYADESRAVEEMQKIYELDANNENLPLLLLREMQKLERDYLGLEFNIKKKANKRYYKIPRKASPYYLIQLQEFVDQVTDEDQIKEKELWLVADAYLELLAGDLYASNKSFTKIKPLIKNEALQEQVEVFTLALQICQYDEIDSEDEEEISEIIRRNEWYRSEKYDDFHDFLFDKLSYDYAKYEQLGKAFRAVHTTDDLKYNIPLEIIDDLLEICNKENPSKLEEALIAKKSGGTIQNDLLEMKATFYLSNFQLEAALETFNEIPRAEQSDMQIHPYRDELLDCVHCPTSDTLTFTKTELVAKMLDLNYQARADLQLGAAAFYKLGLMYYNLSYYGNSWQGMDYFRSGSNWKYENDKNVYPVYDAPFGNHENKDCSQAEFYFEKARLLTKNRELAARAAFMAAKCQHNTWYNHRNNKRSLYSNNIPKFPAEYQIYFDLLKDEYQDTQLYGEAIKECKYFRAYALK